MENHGGPMRAACVSGAPLTLGGPEEAAFELKMSRSAEKVWREAERRLLQAQGGARLLGELKGGWPVGRGHEGRS